MIVINNKYEMKEYYNNRITAYEFNDDVTFTFDINVFADIFVTGNVIAKNIKAFDIQTHNIESNNIKCLNLKTDNIIANDITARNIMSNSIKANSINYFKICCVFKDIICDSIKGRNDEHKHFSLCGKIIINNKKGGK